MNELKSKLYDILQRLEFLACDIDLSYQFHSHINGYFDTVPKTKEEATSKLNELAVLSSVQLTRLFDESKEFAELIKSVYEVLGGAQ